MYQEMGDDYEEVLKRAVDEVRKEGVNAKYVLVGKYKTLSCLCTHQVSLRIYHLSKDRPC